MKDGHWILVVDDDESIRELICIILESRGFEVVTAEEGSEALERLRSRAAPSLVLLDLMMPGMDGLDFVHELRSDTSLRAVPVVVISGDERATRRLERAEVQGCMVKPIELGELVATVERFAA